MIILHNGISYEIGPKSSYMTNIFRHLFKYDSSFVLYTIQDMLVDIVKDIHFMTQKKTKWSFAFINHYNNNQCCSVGY